jgi:hypothetical protein
MAAMGKKKRSPPATPAVELEQQSPAELESQAETMRRLRSERDRLVHQLQYWELLSASTDSYVRNVVRPIKPPTLRGKPSGDVQEMVVNLSDCHATEAWTKDQTDGTSCWNFEEFCRSLWYYGQEIIRLAEEDRGKCGLRVLHVNMLGDIFHGALRIEDEVTNDFPTVPGLVNTTWVLWQWLVLLAGHFERVSCVCVPGNHGRLHKKPQSKRYVDENHDTLIYRMLQKFAAVAESEDRITFDVPRSRVYTHERLGHRIKAGHGDHIRGGNSIANIPIYGLSRELLRQYRKDIIAHRTEGLALIEYGHWHNSNYLESALLINGSLCPAGPWAFDNLGAAAEPCQWVYYTSRRFAIGWRNDLAMKHAPKKHSFSYDKSLIAPEAE